LSSEGAIAFPVLRELTARLIDVDWIISILLGVSTWRNSRLSVLWPFVLGLSRPTPWGFLKLRSAGMNEVCVYSISEVSCCGYRAR